MQHKRFNRILVTGGAGYIGAILVPRLLADGYSVRVYDNLHYGQCALMDVVGHSDLDVVRGDVRDPKALGAAMEDIDAVIHLAGLVGAPVCHRDPELSEAINVTGTKNVVMAALYRPVLFPSTGSSYGHVASGMCTEETPIAPLSEYADQKARAENYVRSYAMEWTIFRFATAFGASPRPRLDLLPNDFVHRAVTQRALVVYEAEFRRTFIHVSDMAGVFVFALSNWPKVKGEVFNVGDGRMNFTKRQVVEKIVARVPGCILNLSDDGKDPDARNYAVDYTKINGTGFQCKTDFDQGLDELFKAEKLLTVRNPYSNAG